MSFDPLMIYIETINIRGEFHNEIKRPRIRISGIVTSLDRNQDAKRVILFGPCNAELLGGMLEPVKTPRYQPRFMRGVKFATRIGYLTPK